MPDHARALIESVKAVERVTIEAALTGSTALAVKALALHPLFRPSRLRARSSPGTVSGYPPGGAVRVNVDLAVLTPAYLDYTFVGLEALPGPGEERFAGDMLRSPGGGAITAVGARRLGLKTALVAPLGDDLAGRFVRRELDAEGVILGEPRGNRTPTTMVMPVAGERSMVTVDPGIRARAADLEPLSPRAVAATLEQIDVVPDDVCTFLTCGDDDARAFAGRLPQVASGRRPRALIVNRREAGVLTAPRRPPRRPPGSPSRRHRRRHARRRGRGRLRRRAGAERRRLGCGAGARHHRRGRPVRGRARLGRPDGRRPEVSLAWANLYAGLSVGAPPAPAGGHARAAARGGRERAAGAARMTARLWPAVPLALLIAGCGAPGEDAPENDRGSATQAKIDVSKAGPVTLTVWDQEVRGGQRRQIETLNAQFQAKYPNVTIKRVAKSFTDLNTTLKLAVRATGRPTWCRPTRAAR